MSSRRLRPDWPLESSIENFRALLRKYPHGTAPKSWYRYSRRTRLIAISRERTGHDPRPQDLPER